jgi:hypothetical protein
MLNAPNVRKWLVVASPSGQDLKALGGMNEPAVAIRATAAGNVTVVQDPDGSSVLMTFVANETRYGSFRSLTSGTLASFEVGW